MTYFEMTNSAAVQNHPRTVALEREAAKRKNREEWLLIIVLVVVIADMIVGGRYPQVGWQTWLVVFYIESMLVSFVTIFLFTGVGGLATNFIPWRLPAANYDEVVAELRDVAKNILSFSNPDNIFTLSGMQAWYEGERIIVLKAQNHIRLEELLGRENLQTPQMIDARNRMLAESRAAIQAIYDRLKLLCIVPDRGDLGFFFQAAKGKNHWPEPELFDQKVA